MLLEFLMNWKTNFMAVCQIRNVEAMLELYLFLNGEKIKYNSFWELSVT